MHAISLISNTEKPFLFQRVSTVCVMHSRPTRMCVCLHTCEGGSDFILSCSRHSIDKAYFVDLLCLTGAFYVAMHMLTF